MWTRLKTFILEGRQELRSVVWPTRAQAMRLTALVVGISLGLALFLGVFDTLFSYLLRTFIVRV